DQVDGLRRRAGGGKSVEADGSRRAAAGDAERAARAGLGAFGNIKHPRCPAGETESRWRVPDVETTDGIAGSQSDSVPGCVLDRGPLDRRAGDQRLAVHDQVHTLPDEL